MKKILLITSLLTSSIAFGQSGEKIAPEDWKDGEIHMSKAAHDRMLFLSENDPLIQKIPVKDNGEPLVDLREKNHPRIKLITDLPNYNLFIDTILPGDIENVKKGFYSHVRQGLYERLVKTLDYLPPNIGIAYALGYQDAQKLSEKFDYLMMKYHKALLDKKLAYQMTNYFIIADIKASSQISGGRLLMTLFDTKTNQILNLGVIGSNPQNITIQEFAAATTEEQRKYRVMLEEATTKAGIVSYGEQWCTFDYGTKIWAYVTGAKETIYGPVKESDKKFKLQNEAEYLQNFDPEKIASKYDTCDDY